VTPHVVVGQMHNHRSSSVKQKVAGKWSLNFTQPPHNIAGVEDLPGFIEAGGPGPLQTKPLATLSHRCWTHWRLSCRVSSPKASSIGVLQAGSSSAAQPAVVPADTVLHRHAPRKKCFRETFQTNYSESHPRGTLQNHILETLPRDTPQRNSPVIHPFR
jgi:hypothetical protein